MAPKLFTAPVVKAKVTVLSRTFSSNSAVHSEETVNTSTLPSQHATSQSTRLPQDTHSILLVGSFPRWALRRFYNQKYCGNLQSMWADLNSEIRVSHVLVRRHFFFFLTYWQRFIPSTVVLFWRSALGRASECCKLLKPPQSTAQTNEFGIWFLNSLKRGFS